MQRALLTLMALATLSISAWGWSCVGGGSSLPVGLVAVGDGSGGIILAWEETNDIWAQRLSSGGEVAWRVRLTDYGTAYPFCHAASDGSGGMIVVWSDWRDGMSKDEGEYHLYAQRVSYHGKPLWTDGGIPVSLDQKKQQGGEVIEDGSGGAIVEWFDYYTHIAFAERLDAEGRPSWRIGLPDFRIDMASDGMGGVIVAWASRSDHAGGTIYAQHFDPKGKPIWKDGGVPVGDFSASEAFTYIVGDGDDAIIIWIEGQEISRPIYAQKIDAQGNLLWGKEGVRLATQSSHIDPKIVGDGAGGAIVIAETCSLPTLPSSDSVDLYAERINSDGEALWARGIGGKSGDGIIVYDLIGDGVGGAIISWWCGAGPTSEGRAYAQRLNSEGEVLWGEEVVEVFADSTKAELELRAIDDGSGGAIVVVGAGSPRVQRLNCEGSPLWGELGMEISL